MKKRDLEKKLQALGWTFLREGSDHEVWTNGTDINTIPRHREINEYTAKGIIKFCRKNPAKKESKK